MRFAMRLPRVYPLIPAALGIGALYLVVGAPLSGTGMNRDGAIVTRSIRTDQHIDLPLDPTHADAPKPVGSIAPVRIATREGANDALKGLTAGIAPLDVVAFGQRPDLVWDQASRTLTERDDVIAYEVTAEDLPAAADRLALTRGLAALAPQGEQAVRLQPDIRAFKAGQRLTVQVPDVLGRTAIVFVVSGDGTLQFLYPGRTDPATVPTADLSFAVDVSAPYGADQIVELTATGDSGDLVTALRRLDRRKAAGGALGLIEAAPKGSLKLGSVRILTQP